jgi:hypothetical protein
VAAEVADNAFRIGPGTGGKEGDMIHEWLAFPHKFRKVSRVRTSGQTFLQLTNDQYNTKFKMLKNLKKPNWYHYYLFLCTPFNQKRRKHV